MRTFDLLIIGTGPAGTQAALRAAQEGRRTAIVERNSVVGGVCLHTGTIPSKTLRQAVLDLSDYQTRGLYQQHSTPRSRPDMAPLIGRVRQVIATETTFQEELLLSRGITVIRGTARFLDPHLVAVTKDDGEETIRGETVLISVGTIPRRPPDIPFDGCRILDTDELLELESLPSSLIIIGGGVIGTEYASILSLLDVKVTLVNRSSRLLPFVDPDLVGELHDELTARDVIIHSGAEVAGVESDGERAVVRLEDGTVLTADVLLYCAGRQSAAPMLQLEEAGLTANASGTLAVDGDFRTAVPHIFAAGDVIGFPSLASASREQGRVAACRALGVPCRPVEEILPFGIYSVPEIAMVGPTEEAARGEGFDVVTGVGRFADTARGQIIGDVRGILKLVVERESRLLMGAHIIGTGATELIHQAQMAIQFKVPYTYFVRTVMNYPTLSRVYKLAAWDLLEKLGD